MSQRNVNLKPDQQFAQQSLGVIQQSTQASLSAVSNIAKRQKEKRDRSEKAMLLGAAKTEELAEKYAEKLDGADAETKTALTSYAREQAKIIGEAKAKAFMPGATKEDKDNYTKVLTQGTSNLTAIASYSIPASKSLNTMKDSLSAAESGTSFKALTRDALNNNDLIEFDAGLASGLATDIVVKNNNKNQVEISFKNSDGKPIKRNVFAANEAFKQNGSTLEGQQIGEDDLLTGKKYLAGIEAEIKEFEDLKATQRIESKYDRGTNTRKVVKVSEVVDMEANMLANHKQMLLQKTTNGNFNKTWDQLYNLDLLSDSKYKDVAWNTFNNKNAEEAVKKLNKDYASYKPGLDFDNPLDPSPEDDEFTVEDYKKVQGEIREDAAKGLARFIDVRFGQPVETIVQEQEQENYYKTNKSGKSEFTPGGKQELKATYKNTYLPAQKFVNKKYNSFADIAKLLSSDSNYEAFGVKTDKGWLVGTGKEIREAFPSAQFPGLQDDAIYQFNNKEPQQKELITKPEFWDFDSSGNLSEDSKQTMYNLLGVNNYEQSVFSDSSSMKELGLTKQF